MPTKEYATVLYPKFGVSEYHEQGIFGAGTSVYIIDTGLTHTADRLLNVRIRTVSEGPRATHGSFVAAIVASKTTPEGYIGIAPEAQVYLADISNQEGVIYTSALVRAIHDAIQLHVDIISISLGTSTYSQDLEDAVKLAASRGIFVLAASGNCSCRGYEFPAACDAAISVASMDLDRKLSSFNTRNDSVALFAPGEALTVPGAKTKLSGTSFAVPFASGLLALELSKRRKTQMQRPTKQEAVRTLRQSLGLQCWTHTYAREPSCPLEQPGTVEGVSWFITFSLSSALVCAYLAGRMASNRTYRGPF